MWHLCMFPHISKKFFGVAYIYVPASLTFSGVAASYVPAQFFLYLVWHFVCSRTFCRGVASTVLFWVTVIIICGLVLKSLPYKYSKICAETGRVYWSGNIVEICHVFISQGMSLKTHYL